MRKALFLLSLLVLGAGAANAAPKHALARAVTAPAVGAKAVVAHPKRSLKYTLGSAAFAVEAGIDAVHVSAYAVNKVAGKADAFAEKAVAYFFHKAS